MFGDMMSKLKDAQKTMEETKKRLDTIYVDAEAENGKVKVTANGNKKIKDIVISEELLKENDKQALEDILVVAVNRALEKAEKVSEAEMQGIAKGILPNFPGLF
ncbi:MAG: YbaB/EbfC family nucleoid-associated protein [Bacteroidota bacterium]|nr:YbaB/EbfC family nucleoid-associated protein [Bacteroidota bacterium]